MLHPRGGRAGGRRIARAAAERLCARSACREAASALVPSSRCTRGCAPPALVLIQAPTLRPALGSLFLHRSLQMSGHGARRAFSLAHAHRPAICPSRQSSMRRVCALRGCFLRCFFGFVDENVTGCAELVCSLAAGEIASGSAVVCVQAQEVVLARCSSSLPAGDQEALQ